MNAFQAAAPEQRLEDLRRRLQATRWPETIRGLQWGSGTDAAYLRDLCLYWTDEFSWRATEAAVNAHPNFVAEIDGYRIHFMHVKGRSKRSVPLIMTHGWPSSFLEMMDVIPLLTQDSDFSFDLVIPSLVGFGFSSKPIAPGCNSRAISELWHKLMIGLGYAKYAAQGGDIGAGVSTWLALRHPQNLLGLHLNYIPGSYKTYRTAGEPIPAAIRTYEAMRDDWSNREGAYAKLQSTKPQTVATALNDSPAGLAGWMLEKFHGWSDNDGNVETALSKDVMLSQISLYWLTQSMPSAMQIYLENAKAPLVFSEGDYVTVPVAFARFAKELPTPPRSYVEEGYNIQQWSEFTVGGHFAAMEQPELLSEDITRFFKKLTP